MFQRQSITRLSSNIDTKCNLTKSYMYYTQFLRKPLDYECQSVINNFTFIYKREIIPLLLRNSYLLYMYRILYIDKSASIRYFPIT